MRDGFLVHHEIARGHGPLGGRIRSSHAGGEIREDIAGGDGIDDDVIVFFNLGVNVGVGIEQRFAKAVAIGYVGGLPGHGIDLRNASGNRPWLGQEFLLGRSFG